MELELIDLLRRTVHGIIGDVAIDDAFKVSRLSDTQLLIEQGEAWFKGLPFTMRSRKDQLVSGASLLLGTVPPGVSVTDSTSGTGKILTFTTGFPTVGSTPTNLYRIVISAEEEIITDIDDPFLKNANLSEATSQKVRLKFKINILTNSTQIETPIPYTPDTGGYDVANMVNQIIINPMANLNGELILPIIPFSTSEQIDGANIELKITNDPALGLGIVIPNQATDQQTYVNGKLIDSLGCEYHISSIVNNSDPTQVLIRLDKEVGQPDPTLTNGQTYKLVKREVYVVDNSSGSPVGKLFWPVATADWNTTNGFVHAQVVSDLRTTIMSDQDFQDALNQAINLVLVGGGVIGVDTDGNTLCWSSNFSIINPNGAEQQITTNSGIVVVDGGVVAYFMNLISGGTISLGNLAVTSTTSGTTISFSGTPDLSQVKKGNVIKIGASIAQILTVNNVGKSVTVSPSMATTGAGTIYRDSFYPATVPLTSEVFVLAARKGTAFVIGNVLNLTGGMSNAIYDERIQYPSGYTASTNITLPVNTRNASKAQYYTGTKGELKIFVNQLLKVQGTDWSAIDANTIQYNFNLPTHSEIHFRIDSLPTGSVGGGSGSPGSLQAAYNIGNLISIVSGVPVTINGPSGQKLLVVNGDVNITGVIDPTGMSLTPVAVNPLQPTNAGIWVRTSDNHLMYEKGGTTLDLSGSIDNLLSGTGAKAIARSYLNSSGGMLPKNTPVYAPGVGAIAKAGASTLAKSKFIGVTLADINDGDSGLVAIAGVVENFTGYSHGAYLFLDTTDGTLATSAPNTSGYYQVRVGLVEGTNLILRSQMVGIA